MPATKLAAETVETVATVSREQLNAESLERPSLVRSPAGRWRLYLSCATPGTKHWRVELLEADHPSRFDPGDSLVVLPGDAKTGVKDPVIRHRDGRWQMWACCHPLADPDEADQMVTEYATSDDGRVRRGCRVGLEGCRACLRSSPRTRCAGRLGQRA